MSKANYRPIVAFNANLHFYYVFEDGKVALRRFGKSKDDAQLVLELMVSGVLDTLLKFMRLSAKG